MQQKRPLSRIMNKAFCNFIAIIVYRQKLFLEKEMFHFTQERHKSHELELVFVCIHTICETFFPSLSLTRVLLTIVCTNKCENADNL